MSIAYLDHTSVHVTTELELPGELCHNEAKSPHYPIPVQKIGGV